MLHKGSKRNRQTDLVKKIFPNMNGHRQAQIKAGARSAEEKLQQAGAVLMSVALVAGLVPFASSSVSVPTAEAAQVAKVSFEGKTKAEVEEMMKHMTIDEIVDAMPLKDKVSQLFVTYSGDVYSGAAGSPMASYTELSAAAKNRLASYPVGGICYFLGDIKTQSQIQSVSKSFQDSNKYGMFLAVDEEGGRVQRIGGTTYDLTQAQINNGIRRGAGIGTQINAMYTYKNQGTAVAKSNAMALADNLLMTGMNWDFAPVADTNSNPNNTIIGARAYSDDYNQAAELVSAAISGFHEKNVMTSIKHFPGHGDTSTDSHAGAALVNKKISQLMTEDLIPFIAGIEAGADSVMLGHLSYIQDDGSLSSDDGLIATNSSDIITGLLRERLGYDGIVITDGMQMGALTNLYGKESTTLRDGFVTGKKYNGYITAAIDYFIAGGDMFLLCGTPFKAIDAIIAEVNAGTISEERIDESVTRVMKAKRDYGIIPAQEDNTEATYISSTGAMQHGTFAQMWAAAYADTGTNPAPVVRLNKDIAATSAGSFGTGTGIAANGDLTVAADRAITLDLNGHTLNKNMTGATTANAHIFNIPANGTITIHDSSAKQNGQITGAGGTIGTVAYATGSSAKFIVDSGTITGNTGTSLIYADASAILRFGIQDNDGNNAGPINITDNNVSYAVDFSGAMYLMGETAINNNGGANLYFNGTGSIVNVQDRGLTGSNASIGITVSDTRADNVVLMKAAGDKSALTGTDLNALFYDTDSYQLELDTTINLVKAEGDVRFVSADGTINDSGTWDEMFDKYASSKAGALTLLRDIEITSNVANPGYQSGNQDSPYKFSYDTTINLNGKKLDITTNARNIFQVLNSATLTINDSRTPYISKEEVNQGGEASFNTSNNCLTAYVDECNGETLSVFKTTYDFSAAGLITMRSDNADVDGAIDLVAGSVILNGGGINNNGNGRAIVIKANTSFVMNNGYLFNGASAGHASSVWVFGNNASATINGGVIAANNASNTTSGSAGAVGIYSGNAKATITGGIFTGNKSANHGGAVSTANNAVTTALTVSGGTFCYNTSAKNGGGIYVNSSATTNIANALISNNIANSGAGIYIEGTSKVSLSGNTSVIANKANSQGGGVYNATSNALSIKDTICVKDNVAGSSKSDIAVVTNGNKIAINGALTSPSRSIGVDLPNATTGNMFATGSGYTVNASDAGKFFIDSDETLFGSLDGNNNVYLEAGEAQYIADNGEVESGDLKELWNKHFAAGESGTIILMTNVALTDDTQLVLESTASSAKLDLNGKKLSLANSRTDNESPIYVPSGSFEITDSSAQATTTRTVVDVPAGTRAKLSQDSNQLTYYTTEHEQTGSVTYKNEADLSNIGHIEYTGGSDPSGIVHVGKSGTFTLTNGLLTCSNGRAILNGITTGTCTSKVNINGGYIAGCKAGLASVLLARNGSTTNINGGIIAGNTNPTGRGTVWMNSVGNNVLNMTGGIISGNYTKGGSGEQGGGAILVEYANTSATITGGLITHNSTDANGGGICYATAAPASGLNISNVVVSANKSGMNGGGIYSGRNIVDPGCHIDANEAKGQGGGIYTTGSLIADSLCVHGNKASKSGGIFAALGLTMRGTMNIEGNTAAGVPSNLDIQLLAPEKVQIVGALDPASRIGVSFSKTGERNQKIVSSTITLNDSYNKIFSDDSNSTHVVQFNDGTNGMYVINEDVEGDELGAASSSSNFVPNGEQVLITAKNTGNVDGGLSVKLIGPGNGTSQAQTIAGGAHTWWTYYFFTPVIDNNTTYYRCYEIVSGKNGGDAKVMPSGDIAIAVHANGPTKGSLPVSDGQYILLDFNPASAPNSVSYSSTSKVGNMSVYDYDEGPTEVNYKIHYLYHYPVSDVMTGEYYIEDQTRTVEKTGVVGQVAYVPYEELQVENYLPNDSHNVVSRTLVDDAPAGGPDWYYEDDSFQGMHGSSDSVNDLYVIYEHLDTIYTYNVEYYDYDTDELIKTDENLSAMSLPIVATSAMKNSVYEHFYKEHTDTIDTITEVAEGEVPSLRLYFKKYPSYSIRYIDSDSGDVISQKTATAAPGTEITLADTDKVLEGYDFISASADSITLSEDGGEVIDLVFEKILYNDYYIDYYDVAEYFARAAIEPVETVTVSAKAGTTVELQEDQQEIIASSGKKYRMRDGFEANVLSGVVPRSGEPLRLSVWSDYIETSYVYIYRYEWNGAAWVRLSWEPVECDSNTVFDVMADGMKEKYVERPGYVLTANPKNVTCVEVGGPSDPTPHIYLYYAKLGNNDSVQKTPNDNGLVPIKRASTKDFINIELFDYGRTINPTAPSSVPYTGPYPIFKGAAASSPIKTIGNLGETIQYDAPVADYNNGEKKYGYNKPTSGFINRLTRSSADNNAANAAVNGFANAYSGGISNNPMSNVLGGDGAPVLADGTSLSYLFSDTDDVSPTDPYSFTSKQVATGIDGLFDYNSETGYYSYSSVKNHAEYNAETNTFDVYDQIITPNIGCYQFGNFLPFTNINNKASLSTTINRAYIKQQIQYARYKKEHETDSDLKNRYQIVEESLNNFDEDMVASMDISIDDDKKDYNYKDIYEQCYSKEMKKAVPKNATNPQDTFYNPITGEKYFESYEDFYNKLYMIDYDEIKNFFFGITFDFDFVQPQNGQIGEKRTDMIFDFEGDDDVLIYIDGKLFLNLAGIHRQVGGQINFTEGTITYRDYNYNEGVTKNASYASQPGYSRLNEGVVTFREALRDAGMNEDEINSVLNEDGTFKDWTNHSFKMFYMERGSGSGVLRLNFNMPLIPSNTLLVAKNITNENPDYQPILSDPFFNMQLVKCDESGHAIINPSTKLAVPYLPEGTEYMIYEDGIYTGRTRTVDKNGIITLRSNQFAVISNFAKPGDIYCVRELIDAKFVEQFDKTTVTNNTIFENNSSASITHTSTSVEPANSVWYENDKGEMINYLIRSSYAMKTDGTTLSSTLFENNLNLAQLGALAITKDIIEGDEAWNEDDEFFFSVALDGRPVPATTSTGEPTTYYVYEKKYDADGKLVIDGTGTKHQMQYNGIVSIKAHEVAVIRYMLAGSEYEICEVNNPSADGSYHPVYDKDDAGNNIYSGKIPVGSVDEPVEFGISNQRAENLVVSKVVENAVEGVDSDYNFRVSIEADDRHIDDAYEYEIVDINADINTNVCELPDLDATLGTHSKFLDSGHIMSVTDVRPTRDTLRFVDGKAHIGDKDYITLKANQKIIIYGLPYQCSYTVSEITDDGEYEAFYKGMNESEFKNGNTAVYVLDSKSDNAGHSNTVEFKNRKVEDLYISKTVSVNVIDELLGKYEGDFTHKFSFHVTDAVYNNAPVSGTFTATRTDTHTLDADNNPTITEEEISFVDGAADFTLSHGQTLTIHGLPFGMTYKVSEDADPAFNTSWSVSAHANTPVQSVVSALLADSGSTNETPLLTLPEKNEVSYNNALILSSLPTTGGIGLIVVALAAVGAFIFAAANLHRSRKKRQIEIEE